MNSIAKADVAAGDALEDVRVLRRLEIIEGLTGEGDDDGATICAIVDVETTGLDHNSDAVIQFAMRRIRVDPDGVITRIGTSLNWFEDPGRPIPPKITRMTGIRDEDVTGVRFPDDDIVHALKHVDLVVAHNAAFDRKWIERRFPDAAGLGWACSMADIEWEERGDFDGRKLGFLVMQCGFFYEAHRADVDVDAVIALLCHRFGDGRTAMSVMLANATSQSWFVRAHGAAFEVKDRLRACGYRWDPDRRVWGKEVRDADRFAEEAWLAANIYAPDFRPRALGPSFEPVTRWERYA